MTQAADPGAPNSTAYNIALKTAGVAAAAAVRPVTYHIMGGCASKSAKPELDELEKPPHQVLDLVQTGNNNPTDTCDPRAARSPFEACALSKSKIREDPACNVSVKSCLAPMQIWIDVCHTCLHECIDQE